MKKLFNQLCDIGRPLAYGETADAAGNNIWVFRCQEFELIVFFSGNQIF
ncbi:MAG TPA: hypothetical protein VJI33_03970 [Candidatus Paceibacterota bacterium]